MFGRKISAVKKQQSSGGRFIQPRLAMVEELESRQLLSATVTHHVLHAATTHKVKAAHANLTHAKSTTKKSTTASASGNLARHRGIIDDIEFSQAPAAVQNGLKTLAATDTLATPTATQLVYLGNRNGIETYTLDYASSGTTTTITVDAAGNAVTQPVESTTTWGTLSGSGTGSNAKAAAEITAIANALGLTGPASTSVVDVSTAANGLVTYSVRLAAGTSTSYDAGRTISVDSSGNPAGDQSLPFSVLPAAIQSGINAQLPAADALAATSTQTVDVLTANGITFYTTSVTSGGTTTTATVNTLGAPATLPSTSTAQFSTIPSAAQMELQALATANGVTTTISSTQSVDVYVEGNGTTIYSVTLPTSNSATGQTLSITVASDQLGNPTVPPGDHGGGCGGGGFGDGGRGFGGGGWGF